MDNYIKITIDITETQLTEIIIAELSEVNCLGFEEADGVLNAYISEKDFSEPDVNSIFSKYHVKYSLSQVKSENWNVLWERNFEPVSVGDFCLIHADFHFSLSEYYTHKVVITPKMSFGTGHHATTYMMVEQMSHLDFKDKKVADFGTGTGILAILSEKLGSTYMVALDNDEWSIENAAENFFKNNCRFTRLFKTDQFAANEKFDIILSNINKNVILDNLDNMKNGLNIGGKLLLSGFLKEDEQDILLACRQHHMVHLNTIERNNWISMLLEIIA